MEVDAEAIVLDMLAPVYLFVLFARGRWCEIVDMAPAGLCCSTD